MVQLISFIIFIVSSAGVAVLLYRKMPALLTLPKNGHHGIKKPAVVKKLEKQFKEFHFDFFQKQVWLHKALSKSRVFILKLERKVGDMLHGIRKKSQELDKKKK